MRLLSDAIRIIGGSIVFGVVFWVGMVLATLIAQQGGYWGQQ